MRQFIHLAEFFPIHKIKSAEGDEFTVAMRSEIAYPSQTTVDSVFDYLYYSFETTQSEMFASAIECLLA
jgi:hypothetical protein